MASKAKQVHRRKRGHSRDGVQLDTVETLARAIRHSRTITSNLQISNALRFECEEWGKKLSEWPMLRRQYEIVCILTLF